MQILHILTLVAVCVLKEFILHCTFLELVAEWSAKCANQILNVLLFSMLLDEIWHKNVWYDTKMRDQVVLKCTYISCNFSRFQHSYIVIAIMLNIHLFLDIHSFSNSLFQLLAQNVLYTSLLLVVTQFHLLWHRSVVCFPLNQSTPVSIHILHFDTYQMVLPV